jgi:molybdopterin synthase sulfur carrier subunit
MKSINIKYFAMFRERAGVESETLEVNFETYGELYAFLSDKYRFELPRDMIQVAVNDEFSHWQERIIPHAKIVFIPPVAGG